MDEDEWIVDYWVTGPFVTRWRKRVFWNWQCWWPHRKAGGSSRQYDSGYPPSGSASTKEAAKEAAEAAAKKLMKQMGLNQPKPPVTIKGSTS